MSQTAIAILSVEELGATPASPYRRILVPIDGSAVSVFAAEQALALAASTGAAIVFLTVNEPFHLFSTSTEMIEASREEYEHQSEAHADRILEAAGAAASDAGVPFITVRKWNDDPFREIIDVAQERCCELIAMGSHGRRGLSAVMLGSVTNKVLSHSNLPVLVIRKRDDAQNYLRPTVGEASGVFGQGVG
jgi:nucleotide-binding universal stress UspA family protein